MLLKGDFVYRNGLAEAVVSAAGSTLVLRSGRNLIDLTGGGGCCLLGYNSDHVHRALARVSRLPSKPQFCESTTRIELSELLAGIFRAATGYSGRFGFDLGGAQGIEQALKVVSSAKPQAKTVLTFSGAYHGRSFALAPLSSSRRYLVSKAAGSVFDVVRLPVPDLVREALHCSESEAVEICLSEVRQLFYDERFGLIGDYEPLHSLVFEPVMNVAGLVPLHLHYLRQVIEWAKARGASIVADEIFTGLWRTGPFLASGELIDLVDVVVISKGLTNGLAPLSVVWVKDGNGLADTYRPGTHSSTYISNELSLAIALEVLPDLQRHCCLARGTGQTPLYQQLLSQLLNMDGTSAHQFGCAASVRFDSENKCVALQERAQQGTPTGLIFASTGLAKNRLIMHPAVNISDSEIQCAADVLAAVIQATA